MTSGTTSGMGIGQFRELAGTVVRCLPNMDSTVAQGWIDSPEALRKVLTKALCPPEATTPELNAWKTIKLGTGLKTVDDFRRAIKDGGFRVSNWASDILGKPAFTVAAEETKMNLVVVSVSELGFKDGAQRSEIYKRAQELGLEICPAEVGPQLRLQYNGQPRGEWLLIGMEPIADSDGDLWVFSVGHDVDGLWLRGGSGDPHFVWHGSDRWVFARRK